ncbi:MAG TPA: hypothetical protein VH475_27965 [Tepidisphaeraceae bacterium]|jgi:hypothetical protein
MTLNIELAPELEDRLKSEAQRRGVAPENYARQLIESGLDAEVEAQKRRNQATLDLFAQWAKRDATDDPAELARREQELEEFKKAMNETREQAGARKIYP